MWPRFHFPCFVPYLFDPVVAFYQFFRILLNLLPTSWYNASVVISIFSCYLIKLLPQKIWYSLLGGFALAFAPVLLDFLCSLTVSSSSGLSPLYYQRSSSYLCYSTSWSSTYFFLTFVISFSSFPLPWYHSHCLRDSGSLQLFLFFSL